MENLTIRKKSLWFWLFALLVGISFHSVYASSPSDYLTINASNSGIDSVVFSFGCIDGQPGDTVCIPVVVENFNDIVIAQFEIIWDSDVLDYIEISNPGSPSINVNADFNLSGPNALKFIPLGFPIAGESLPDGTVFFEVCFRIIGVPGSTSSVGISPFFDFEVANVDGVIPSDSNSCVMTVSNAIDLVGFVKSCGPAVLGGNGDIEVTVYGGTAPYTITWLETITSTPGGPILIPSEGGTMFINAPEGNYDVIITDALGASVSYNIDIDTLALSVFTRLRHPTCYKFENGTMWIKPLGGSAPFSFIWESLTDPSQAGSGFIRNPGDSSLVTSLPDGLYRILVKDDNGCEAEVTVTLNDNPFIFNVDDIQDAMCNGSEDGYISLSISGATPDADGNYTIIIKPGFEVTSDMVTIGLLNPGVHTITVSDEVSQCDTVFTFTIGSSTTITANLTAVDVSCFGSADGSVSVRGLTNGISGPFYSYTIYNSQGIVETSAINIGGTFNYSPLAPGDYSVIVEDGPCLSDTIYFTISEPPPMTVTVGGTTIDDCLPAPPQFATGTAWFIINDGVPPYILNAGAGTQDADTLTDLNSGNYVVTVTDANGCTSTAAFVIYDGDDNEEADITFQIDGTPCDGGTVTLFYQGGGLPPGSSVNWNNGMTGQTITIEDGGIINVDLFIPSIHCILNDTVIINCMAELELDITVINPACNDEAVGGPYTGTVIVDTAHAVAPVTWSWSFQSPTQTGTVSGLSPGKYYVTVTDALDSIAIDSFEIVAPEAINYTIGTNDSTSCAGICDGSVMISLSGGDPTMDYQLYWTNSVPFADTGIFFSAQDLCEGITTFSATQDGICFYEEDVEILAPEPVEIDLVNANDASCFGFDDGSLEVVATGGTPGYTYNWIGGPSSALFNGITAGEYYVNVTDSKNCTSIDSFTILQPDSLVAEIDLTGTVSVSCGASNDGVVTVAVTGGNNGIYNFQWNPDVSTIHQAVNLAAGQYLVTVTDSKGCTDTTSYTLTSPPPIVVDWPEVTPPACFGEETVLQIDNVTGGNGNYSFTLNGGGLLNIGDPVLIPSGIYMVSVFDDKGCSSDSTYTIIEPNPILVSISPNDPVIDLGDSIFLMGNIDQSDNPIAMTMWSAEAPVSCPTCDGTWVFNFLPTLYTWTVTDVNGCQGSTSIMVGVDFERDVFFPTAFSPNNDGRNDDFKIYTGRGVVAVNYLHIYDRWGNLVHSETGIIPNSSGAGNWDGTYNGDPLSPGVYVYVAEVEFIDNSTRLVYKGDVTLIK